MPIKVQCACGKAFAAKDELAGKTVKCPSCQKPLKIPSAAPAAAKAPAKPAVAPAPKPGGAKPAAAVKPAPAKPAPAKPAAPAAVGSDSLYDEIGLQAAEVGTRPCPGCTQPMPIEAVVCIKCGYNARMGRRMETEKVGAGEEVGHGAIAQEMLDRAANVMDEDAQEEKKKTGEGMPWWVYLIVLSALIGFAAYLLMRGGDKKSEEDQKGFIPQPGERLLARSTHDRRTLDVTFIS